MYKTSTRNVFKPPGYGYKLLRIMKLSIIILFLSIIHASAASYAQKITLNKKNSTLQPIFNEIGKQSGYDIFYDANTLKDTKRIDINLTNVSVEEALKAVLNGQSLSYTIENKIIVIKRKDLSTSLSNQATVRGSVVDATGEGLPSATVTVKGTKNYNVTNFKGEFELRNVKANDILVVSYLGFVTQEIPVSGKFSFKVVLVEDKQVLNEVVVTALGIKRESKSLGYSVGQVSGEDLMDAVSNNWTDGLTGKVAGLNLIKSGGGPAGSNKIILRGEGNLSGDNSALIVIDGVIVSSRITEANGAYLGAESPVDFGNGISDLNPEDIESVSVLKGAGAAALYGYRGANGAIMITTKSGKSTQKGMGISFNSNTTFGMINRWPDYQYEYGQGGAGQNTWYSYNSSEDGGNTRSTGSAWGAKFNGQEFYQYDPNTNTKGTERTPWVPYKNNRKDFFETAQTFTNSISVSGGTGKTTARLNYTNLKNTWIVPNTGFNRNTIALSVSQKVNDKLSVSTKINFNNKSSDNLPSTGYNNQTIMYTMIALVPNADINWYRRYWVPGFEGLEQVTPMSSPVDNPFLQAYEMLNKSGRDQLVGTVNATYEFNKNLSLMIRSSIDWSSESRSQRRPKDTYKFVDGMFRTQDIAAKESNHDFLLTYKTKFNEDFDAVFTAGGSSMLNNYKLVSLSADKLRYPGIYTFANSVDRTLGTSRTRDYATSGLYGLAQFGFKDYLFVDVTARNDWASTLATETSIDNADMFYSSVNFSGIVSEAFKLPSAISYFKVRASWAQVGAAGVNPYLTGYDYVSREQYPSGIANPTSIANPTLKNQMSTSIEFGTDIRLFKNRLSFDATYYRSNIADQILSTPLDKATGWSSIVLNSGLVRNKGIELQANGSILKSKKGLNWDLTATYAANTNTIVSLADSISTYLMQSGPRGTMEARVGGRMGDLYGLGYSRSPDGQIIYNSSGYPVLTDESIYLGKATPDFTASISNTFRYKQLRLKLLFDGQFGAVAYSHTHSTLAVAGKLNKTLPGRYNGIIGQGVQKNADGTFRPNDVVATVISSYYSEHFKSDNVEANTFSTDFIKFREARIDFTLPAKLVKRLNLQSAMIGVYGRDLFVISEWPSFDPEFGTLGSSDIQRGFEVGQFPSTRNFGVNVSFSF
jgi:TonB-linked SusC/RagA family outer membrane protein